MRSMSTRKGGVSAHVFEYFPKSITGSVSLSILVISSLSKKSRASSIISISTGEALPSMCLALTTNKGQGLDNKQIERLAYQVFALLNGLNRNAFERVMELTHSFMADHSYVQFAVTETENPQN